MDELECIEQIRRWRESHGGLPLFNDLNVNVDDAPWGQPSWWEPQWWESFDQQELVERILSEFVTFNDADPDERCFHVTAVWQQFGHTWIDVTAEFEQRRKGTLQLVGKQLLDERPATSVREPDLLRWEVAAAAEFQYWERLDELHIAWRRLGGIEVSEAERAVARVKTLSCLIEPEHAFPEAWLDYRFTESKMKEPAQSIVAFCATAVGGATSNRLAWPHPGQLSDMAVRRVYEASDGFERVEAAHHELTPIECALAAWCDAVIGKRTGSNERLRRALLRYSSLRDVSFAGPLQAQVDQALPLTVARLACWALDYSQALEFAEMLVSRAGADAWAWELLAQVRRRLGDEHGWVDAYNRFIDLSPHLSEDWERNELLLLGLRHREAVKLADMVAAAPALKSDLDVTKPLLALEWPEFLGLGAEATERWLTALTHLTNPRMAAAYGDLRWAIATEAAGEAVASQLRTVVVVPFRRWLHEMAGLDYVNQLPERERPLGWALRNNTLSMGQVLRLIKSSSNRQSKIGSYVRDWLDAQRTAWAVFIRDSNVLTRLDDLTEVRNPATHELMSSITDSHALETYKQAKRFLTDLARVYE